MSRRWMAGIAGMLLAGLFVLMARRRSNQPMPSDSPAVADSPVANASPTPTVAPIPPSSNPTAPPGPTPLPTPAPPPRPPIPSAPPTPVTVADQPHVAGLAQDFCLRAAAGDIAGVEAILGPGWHGDPPLDQLRAGCSDELTAAMATEGEFGDATVLYGESVVQRWATRSGLDAHHCMGLSLRTGRVMVCRSPDHTYRIATVDFDPRPPDSDAAVTDARAHD